MQSLVLGDEVLEVDGGFAVEIAVNVVVPKTNQVLSVAVSPNETGRDLQHRIANSLGLGSALRMLGTVSGSIEAPGVVDIIECSSSFERYASSFCSLMVLADELGDGASSSQLYTMHVTLPLAKWAMDPRFGVDGDMSMREVTFDVPCTGTDGAMWHCAF